ncbi:NAD(P)H-dependent oxidoreductase [Avrilella dinanensis]|uniref:NAD(P)H-dependent oxidoreductase n=1 Tax=Avrilella dinanensis TaxID=2008672 RepID=A0A2M9R5G3_9FLAO|nr:NAD(P)H-dependent oxidoreductase [Avrilella dinanensis]PJR04099.1 NAD(P)H-dependent oxidoreductase [Avrilella dinanensis]
MDLIQDLNWRYATKSYSNKKISNEKLDFILEATNLSASSVGLQPYRILSIDNAELKTKLGANSFNKQIAQSSHLLVFAAYNKVTTQHVRDLVKLTADKQGVTIESLDGLFTAADTHFKSRSDEENKLWAERQTYIALGTALIAAANAKVDATPMEGFDAELFDELLGLKERDLHSVVILSLGYRDEATDYLANRPKVRIPVEEMVTKIS